MSHIQALDKDCCCRWVRHGRTVVTNNIYPEEDAQFLVRFHAGSGDRILSVETGGCLHTPIREFVFDEIPFQKLTIQDAPIKLW